MKPIIFDGAMVQQILAGQKTQTRRVMNPQPPEWVTACGWTAFTPEGKVSGRGIYKDEGPAEKFFRMPYAKGQHLWVRETWRAWERDTDGLDHIWYRADDEKRPIPNTQAAGNLVVGKFGRWQPALFMPRLFSRITLEVTQVRIQRVQEISEEDAQAEGVHKAFRVSVMVPGQKDYHIPNSYRGGFCNKWDSLNAERGFSWDANPWVYCLSFRRVEAQEQAASKRAHRKTQDGQERTISPP